MKYKKSRKFGTHFNVSFIHDYLYNAFPGYCSHKYPLHLEIRDLFNGSTHFLSLCEVLLKIPWALNEKNVYSFLHY